MDKRDEDCSYCCFTIVALSIAFCSAVITFLVANYMYTGIPCHDDATPFQLPDEMQWLGSERLIVPLKRVVVIKLQQQKRCYILPTRLAKDAPNKKFSILNEPLSEALMKHFAGKEGLEFCANFDGYLLEEVIQE